MKDSEGNIITYWAESSFDHEDKEKEYPEYIVIGATYDVHDGETRTVATFDGMENLQAFKDFLKVLEDPYSAY